MDTGQKLGIGQRLDQMLMIRHDKGRGYPVERYVENVTVISRESHELSQTKEMLAEIVNMLAGRGIDKRQTLTRDEAASLLGICTTTLDLWRQRNFLIEGRHYVKVVDTVRFHPNFLALLFEDKLMTESRATSMPKVSDVEQHREPVASVPHQKPKRNRRVCPFGDNWGETA